MSVPLSASFSLILKISRSLSIDGMTSLVRAHLAVKFYLITRADARPKVGVVCLVQLTNDASNHKAISAPPSKRDVQVEGGVWGVGSIIGERVGFGVGVE